jgi:hypothetical protein
MAVATRYKHTSRRRTESLPSMIPHQACLRPAAEPFGRATLVHGDDFGGSRLDLLDHRQYPHGESNAIGSTTKKVLGATSSAIPSPAIEHTRTAHVGVLCPASEPRCASGDRTRPIVSPTRSMERDTRPVGEACLANPVGSPSAGASLSGHCCGRDRLCTMHSYISGIRRPWKFQFQLELSEQLRRRLRLWQRPPRGSAPGHPQGIRQCLIRRRTRRPVSCRRRSRRPGVQRTGVEHGEAVGVVGFGDGLPRGSTQPIDDRLIRHGRSRGCTSTPATIPSSRMRA